MLLDVECIDESAISKLVNTEYLAIRIKRYIPESHALNIGDKILSPGFEQYINAPSIGRIGMAFYEAENKPELVDEYFRNAQTNIKELRQRCAPYSSPIDTLRCQLDEAWPAGAHLETMLGKKMYVGLSRVVNPGVHFLAHHDIFAKDAPDSFKARSLKSQFACNVYLNMPTQGGTLQIWKNELSPEEFDTLRQNSYGIDPTLLGKPDLDVTPEPGDLVLFDSTKMHAVTPGQGGQRLSLSCFIGYRGESQPLTYWS